MADKVKPLGLESPSNGGSESYPVPTELDPTEDYVSAKGLSLENRDDALINLQGSSIGFVDPVSGTHPFKSLKSQDYCLQTPLNPFIQVTSDTFAVVTRFVWRGTSERAIPATIRAIAHVSESGVQGKIRLFDLSNNTTLGTSSAFSSVNPELVTISCSNWASSPSIIEVQMRRSTGTGTRSVRISSLSLEW